MKRRRRSSEKNEDPYCVSSMVALLEKKQNPSRILGGTSLSDNGRIDLVSLSPSGSRRLPGGPVGFRRPTVEELNRSSARRSDRDRLLWISSNSATSLFSTSASGMVTFAPVSLLTATH
ncbi:hypothetical protein EYF80_031018 [Liparis tanakae]|uniref:Uncharacterized protein n=1 Tax=Liparis tanakae TaxID=230148 RepID=A0A4Z2H122_9TELE|nr:hypothetical protein EYF80_031018 [Liparis tanakae]